MFRALRWKSRVVRGQADQDRAAVERPLAGRGLGLADGLGRLGLGQVGPADRPQDAGDLLGLGGCAVGASPSTTSAWPSWNLESMAMRIAARTAFLGIE